MTFEAAIAPLLDCMCTSLAEAGWEGQCCINPGMPAFDSCCEDGGEAWARLVQAFPSRSFPQDSSGAAPSRCGDVQWALQLELGATMCACFDQCDCTVKAENAARILRYSEAALKGLLCCVTDGPCSDREVVIGSVTIGGPEGGCSAFKIEVTVQYDVLCQCPPDDES